MDQLNRSDTAFKNKIVFDNKRGVVSTIRYLARIKPTSEAGG
jgi:hypothetical protein